MSAPLDVLVRVEAVWGRESPEYAAVAELVEVVRELRRCANDADRYYAVEDGSSDEYDDWVVALRDADAALAKFGGAA